MKNKSKTKILYIGPIPPEIGGQSTGGIATHAWQLATQAYKRGYDVYILANTSSSFMKDGVKVLNPSKKNKLLKAFCSLKFWLSINKSELNKLNFLSFKEKVSVLYGGYLLQEIINFIKPNIIHIHSLCNLQTLSLKLLHNSIPLIITDHGIGVVYNYETFKEFDIKDKNKLQKKLREASKTATYIISVSDFSKDQSLKVFHFFDDMKIKTILNPVDVAKLQLLNKKEIKEDLCFGNKKVVFFSGVHNPIKKKGLDILLKAFDSNDYLHRGCKLLVVTKGEAITFAQNFVKEKNIDGVILKPQPWEKLVKYYNAADIFVLPSRTEGIGLVYEEALLAGVPVVGFPESLRELEYLLGIYIGEKFDASREDEKTLAEKITKVLNTDFDRELVRKKVIENLSWDAKFSEFDSVYKEALQTKDECCKEGGDEYD